MCQIPSSWSSSKLIVLPPLKMDCFERKFNPHQFGNRCTKNRSTDEILRIQNISISSCSKPHWPKITIFVQKSVEDYIAIRAFEYFERWFFFGFYNSFAIFDTRRFYLHFRDFRTKIKFWHSVFKCQKEIIKPPSGHKNHDRLKRWLSRDHLLKEQDNDVKWLIFLKTIQNVMIMVLRFLWFGTWGHPVWHERYT